MARRSASIRKAGQLPTLAAVIRAALIDARAIIGADALVGWIALDQRIAVEDEVGTIVGTLQFEDAVQVTRT
jgi:hypothetical protein